jgi:hypothetical protein
MGFTNDQQLEILASGQSDWDTSIDSNFAILERGHHFVAVAGSSLNSGDICRVNSLGQLVRHNPSSLDLGPAHAMSLKQVSSGSAAQFLHMGVVRSMTVWSGNITPGQPVFVSATSPGFAVSSYNGANEAVGLALDNTSILFKPGSFRFLPERVSQTTSLATAVGTQYDFVMGLGHRGIVRDLIVQANSCNNFKVQFWSGSSRVGSELLYNTLTTSGVDVNTVYFRDSALFPFRCTDASSWAQLYGRVTVQSGSAVSSDNFSVFVSMERFR